MFGYAHFCATVSKRALPSCRRASDWVKVRSCSGQNRFSLTLSIRLAMNDSHCPSGLFRMATERLQGRICCMPSENESEWVSVCWKRSSQHWFCSLSYCTALVGGKKNKFRSIQMTCSSHQWKSHVHLSISATWFNMNMRLVNFRLMQWFASFGASNH